MSFLREWWRRAKPRTYSRLSGRRTYFRPIVCERLEERLSTTVLPLGFFESLVANSISRPTAMAMAEDGRIFVAEQGGSLRVIKEGTLLQNPFVSLPVNSVGERGLLGVALDPNFAVNHYVYVYYTTADSPIHNRISRFVASGDQAQPASEEILLELNNLSSATNHNGGAIHFGEDGKLYVGVGDNANGSNSQSMTTLLGKMLRINADGSIPTDNPFFNTAEGQNRAIWAMGLRNPFTFAVDPASERIFINDVGQNQWEEINDGQAGANYGWPSQEGITGNTQFTDPLHAYSHGAGNSSGCAIAGGAFYSPDSMQFPSDYAGDYFFADLCNAWIGRYDAASDMAAPFATQTSSGVVDLLVDDAGSLYYLSRGDGTATGAVFKVQFAAHAWQNPVLHADVDGHDGVVPLDALIVINDLNENGPRALPTPPPVEGGPPPYLDVNGDDHVTPLDALAVINVLNA